MSTLGQNFTKAEQDAGWPETLKHGQLAALQYPYSKGETARIRLARDRAGDILSACKSGELPHTATTVTVTPPPLPIQRRNEFASSEWTNEFGRFGSLGVRNGRITSQTNPQPHDVTTYTVAAPAFAAWLAAQPETPSEHIAAWFEAVGVNTQPEAAPVPTDETIEDRNDRWLAFYESEEKAGRKRGAYERGSEHFNVDRSLYNKAVKATVEKRAEKYRAGMKTVPAKGGAGGWGSQLVKDGKKTKGTKAKLSP